MASIAGLLVYIVAWPYLAARLQQVIWSRTRLGDMSFRTEIAARPLFRLVFRNVFLTLLTGGSVLAVGRHGSRALSHRVRARRVPHPPVDARRRSGRAACERGGGGGGRRLRLRYRAMSTPACLRHPLRRPPCRGHARLGACSRTRHLVVETSDGTVLDRVVLSRAIISDPFEHAPRMVWLPTGATLEVPDADRHFARELEDAGVRLPLAVRLQRWWPAVLTGLAAMVAGLAVLYVVALPAAAHWVAFAVPPSLEARMGQQVLAVLDRHYLRAKSPRGRATRGDRRSAQRARPPRPLRGCRTGSSFAGPARRR